ncbi:MAG: alanine--tRNA ligase [Verrucomicrobiota bacterium]
MTAAQIRQSFLDFFREKKHTVVPSSSLMPDSPNLLFTNAGMNQFVPIFLGERAADVSKWAGAVPSSDTRAADTQKCIRAGGKHNDLDDVGLDTYHHTFFEMLGNWSFGDYFKKEAIEWAWELVIERWKFPAERVYATIYQPGANDPADRDQEAWELWAEKFRSIGLDPDIHIVNGNKKDNFWMMGDTGPCGPCTEIHIDLTPGPVHTSVERQREGAKLVNGPDARCIEIWNNVFIQYNARITKYRTDDLGNGVTIEVPIEWAFDPLPAKHVDTGMGFERVVSIIHGTKNFTDFENAKISNYETDVFRPIFDEIEKMCGKKYGCTLPATGTTGATEQEKEDVAFRVIADHIRTLSFAIADGISPGNNDRNYVLRRILRRAVRYGRTLGFREPFFYKLVDVLARTMGDVFPNIRERLQFVKDTLKREEEAFNKTLDRGIQLFEEVAAMPRNVAEVMSNYAHQAHETTAIVGATFTDGAAVVSLDNGSIIPGDFAFKLYDTYGFPLDLTELMARERGLTVDKEGFEKHMEEQRSRARAAQKKTVIELSEVETKEATRFLGYDELSTTAKVLEVVALKDKTAVILDASTAYAEMGGQIGDSGEISAGANSWRIANTTKVGHTWLHFLESSESVESIPSIGAEVTLTVDRERRAAIQRHHTVTHLLHWALHEVVSKDATQKGSSVAPDKLTFDFNSAALTPQQVRDIERLVNERILENAPVVWNEVPYASVRGDSSIMQFFGDKYGEIVRVVDIGGYSKELCAGTHTRATGEIGLFRIASEAAIAAGVRRIEAAAGLTAYDNALRDSARLADVAAKIGSPIGDLEKKLEALLAQQKELEKSLKSAQQREAAGRAKTLLASAENNAIVANLGDLDGDSVMHIAEALKGSFPGIVVLGAASGGAVTLIAAVGKEFQSKVQAGKIIQTIAPIVGGKGGGKPDFARGGGKDASKLDAALAAAKGLF